jgi:muramoyltetrapeptide carboxypeptidase
MNVSAPPPLAPGARVALVAPAGPVRDESDIARAVENAERLGWTPVIGEHARARHGYLAGEDRDRLADLNLAAADDSIDGIWCIRGGYGAMRLLDDLDYESWQRRPKALLGYSDVTALHAAIGGKAGIVTYHAPTARAELTPFSLDSLRRAVIDGRDSCGVAPAARTLCKGRARGRLAGGNLALLSALAGTPYAPRLGGAILVLEDVNESVYRIDRMLTQLRLSGALRRCAGIVFGGFTDIPPEPTDETRSLDDVLSETAEMARIPCFANAPIGHIRDQWTVPLGAIAELDADERGLWVVGRG